MMELITVIVILGIIFTMLVYVFAEFRSVGYLADTEAHVIGALRDARSRTLASRGDTVYGVHFEETKVVLFVGSTYDSVAATNEIYTLPIGVRISAIVLGGGAEVVYARLTGNPSVSGSVTFELKKDSAQTRTVTILPSGIIN